MDNGWTERIKELEAERDTWHDRAIAVAAHLDYETTCDNIKIWVYEHKKKVRAIDKRIEELEAENRRLREALDLVISFIPDGWGMPLGFNRVVAQVNAALAGKEAKDGKENISL